MMRTFILPVIIVVVFLMGAATLMATSPMLEPTAKTPVLTKVRILDVKTESVALKVNSQGSVMPSTETQLIPEVNGRILWMSPNFVAGGYFAKDEVLARVDQVDYTNAKNRAQAALGRAEAEEEHARFEYKRMQSLAERKLISRSQLENALRASRVAVASLQDAKVSAEQAQQNLGRTEIRAPFDGLVRTESVDVGQFISRGAVIASIYASDAVEVRLPIADRQLAFLDIPVTQRGELPLEIQPEVVLTTEYAGQQLRWVGKIVRTEAEIDLSSRMVQLVARVPTITGQPPLTVGLFVDAQIAGRTVDNVVVLPRSALRNSGEVLIVDADDKIRFRAVDQLRLYQDNVLIEGGLEVGDRVCLSPLQTAIDGMTVLPVADTI